MARTAVRLGRTALLLGAVLGFSIGTFLLLDLLELTGTDRFLAYLLVTTAIAGGLVVYATFVVVGHARQPLNPGDESR